MTPPGAPGAIALVLCGDVMLGRGIDRILPHPGDPTIDESWRGVRSADVFVALARRKNGPIPEARGADYVWGDALAEFEDLGGDLRLVNLETAVTARGEPWPQKRVRFRMNPANIGVLGRAHIDFCALANNHVLDWGYAGLADTIAALDRAGISHAGAGTHRARAAAPAILRVPGKGRVLIVSLATVTSGTPYVWAAEEGKPGVNLIELTDEGVEHVYRSVSGLREPGDLLVVSIHWRNNYGYDIHPAQRVFARRLIDEVQVDLIHGHSSHHVRAIELYAGKPILYGCGDLINDYEGIPDPPGRERFFPQLKLLYCARFAPGTRRFLGLDMRPVRMRRLRVERGDANDAAKLCEILNREGAASGTRILDDGGTLRLDVARG